MKVEPAKKWLGKLTKLHPASGRGVCRGKAPHKPLLLLCLLDMAEAGEGLWSVQADGRVSLAPYRFTENGPEALRLQPYAGRLLQFADGVTLRPKGEYFARHRTFHGLR